MGVIDLSRLQASRGGWLLLFKISTSLFSPCLTASPLSGRGEEERVSRPQDCPPRPRRPPNGRKPQRGREGEVGPRRAAAPRGSEAGRPNIPLARPPADPLWGEAREGVVGPLGSPAVSREGENGKERSRRAGRALSEAQRQPTCLSLPLPARRMPRRHGQSCSGRVDSIERRRSSCLRASPRLHSDTVVGRS